MRLGEMNTGTLKSPAGMTRAEIESTVKHIVAVVVDEYGLMEAGDVVSLDSNLHNDLGMDEVDLIELLFRAEERFGLVLPDSDIGPSSTVSDIVDRVVERLSEKEARLVPAQPFKAAWENAPEPGSALDSVLPARATLCATALKAADTSEQ